jgi:hypothetical protein
VAFAVAPSDILLRSIDAVTAVEAPPARVPPVGDTLNGAGLPFTLKSSGRSPVLVRVIDPDGALVPRSMRLALTLSRPGRGGAVVVVVVVVAAGAPVVGGAVGARVVTGVDRDVDTGGRFVGAAVVFGATFVGSMADAVVDGSGTVTVAASTSIAIVEVEVEAGAVAVVVDGWVVDVLVSGTVTISSPPASRIRSSSPSVELSQKKLIPVTTRMSDAAAAGATHAATRRAALTTWGNPSRAVNWYGVDGAVARSEASPRIWSRNAGGAA